MTRKQTLLNLLGQADQRGVTTAEILQAGVGSRYGARLMELRQDGHVISAERLREGSWRYVLLSKSGAGLSGAAHTAPDLGEQLCATCDGRGSVVVTVPLDGVLGGRREWRTCPNCAVLPLPDEQLFDTPKPKTHRGYGDMEDAA